MRLPHARTRSIIVIMCLALVALRVGGVHLHLCLDGSEPPVSYHLADSGIHHDEHPAGETHSDRELAAAEDLLLKKPGASFDTSMLVFALALLLFLVVNSRVARLDDEPPRRRPQAFAWLRPPLRGPPSPA